MYGGTAPNPNPEEALKSMNPIGKQPIASNDCTLPTNSLEDSDSSETKIDETNLK